MNCGREKLAFTFVSVTCNCSVSSILIPFVFETRGSREENEMRPAKIFGKPTAAWKFGGLSDCFTKTFGEFKLNTNKESYRTDQTVPFDGPIQETFFTLFSKYHRFSLGSRPIQMTIPWPLPFTRNFGFDRQKTKNKIK